MKTFRFILFAIALTLVSCTKEGTDEPVSGGTQLMSFCAELDGKFTKTTIEQNEAGAAISWLSTDKISVFDGNSENREFTTGQSGKSVNFSGNAVDIAEGGYWYAVYPYSALNNINGTTISTSLPSVQEVESAALADGANVTAAKSSSKSFMFKNICGLIQISVPEEVASVKSVTINSDKAIAGSFTIDCSGEAPVFASAGSDASKSITLKKKDGSVLTAGNWYVAALPGTHNISIILTDNDDKSVIYGGNISVDVKSSRIISVGEVDSDAFDHATGLVKSGEDLQAAIDKASAGDRILVSAGTFTGNFTIKDGVSLSGGWNDDFTVCDPDTYKTILDGGQKGRVVGGAACEQETVVSGFVIKNGKGAEGAGIYAYKNMVVKDCEICYNDAGESNGGGIYVAAGATAYNCHIHHNSCSKDDNGAGVYVKGTLHHCTLENNSGAKNGGGAQVHGGTMYNCIVRNNSATNGGGVRSYNSGELGNLLVYGNEATGSGVSGLLCEGEGNVVNCTVVNNYDSADAGNSCGLRANNAEVIVKNCIVFGNYSKSVGASEAVQLLVGKDGVKLLNNAYRTGGLKNSKSITETGSQTIAADAIILDDNFMLNASATMCKDKGDDNIPSHLTTDLAGNPRKVGTIDIGCYEVQ